MSPSPEAQAVWKSCTLSFGGVVPRREGMAVMATVLVTIVDVAHGRF